MHHCLSVSIVNQGYTIGGDFAELKQIIDQIKYHDRIGVCLDTCHAFAAGERTTIFKKIYKTLLLNLSVFVARVFHFPITFSTGYDLRTPDDWRAMIKAFDDVVGLKYLKAMHINDSKGACCESILFFIQFSNCGPLGPPLEM